MNQGEYNMPKIKYNLATIVVHIEDLISNYEYFYDYYLNEIDNIVNNYKKFKKKELRLKIQRLIYQMDGHTLDIVESFKICNNYLYMSNWGKIAEDDYKVDLDELKYERRNLKKKHKKKLNKTFDFIVEIKGTRNDIAHTMSGKLKKLPIMKKDKILEELSNYLNLFNQLHKVEELVKKRKRKENDRENLSILSDINKEKRSILKRKSYLTYQLNQD